MHVIGYDLSPRGDEVALGPVKVTFMGGAGRPGPAGGAGPGGAARLPLRRVADYAAGVPDDWHESGGLMLPLHAGESPWLSFACDEPAAVQVGVDGECLVSGNRWGEPMSRDPRNYLVLPEQPWLGGVGAGGPGGLVDLRCVGLTASALARWESEREASGDPPVTAGGVEGALVGSLPADPRRPVDYDLGRAWSVRVRLCPAAKWEAITGEPLAGSGNDGA